MNESHLVQRAIERIATENPKLAKRIRTFVKGADAAYHQRAEDFFERYRAFIEAQGKIFEFGVDSFLRLQHNMDGLRTEFVETGKYPNTSFDEVNRSVYSNPEVMEFHMHGLVFAQFLWPDQYLRFQSFADHLPGYAPHIEKYLEVGGGHALYVSEAARQLPHAQILVVDISETSLTMARGIAGGEPGIEYRLMNIFDFPDDNKYDFITMGEVLEHVEQPRELLAKIRRLLAPQGRAYITTPANAPMLDHIYLFNNAAEIRAMFVECGFRIEHEALQFANASLPEEMAERMKLPLMYAAFVTAD